MSALVLTVAVGEKYKRIADLTLPTIGDYALKIGADCIVLNEEHMSTEESPHWLKFKIYGYLKKYDRILFLDSDLIVRSDTPNLFEVVPEGKLGIFNEAGYTYRTPCIEELIQVYGFIPPKKNEIKYYNTGVMVLSRKHRQIFRPLDDYKPLVNSFGEQTFLNYRIQSSGVEIMELDFNFNRMSCLDAPTGLNRLSSYIIHYAGCPSTELMESLIKKDLNSWKENPEYKFKRTISITIGGGMGDQLCAEPVLRFIRKCYSKETTDIYCFTHWKRLFKHLENDFIFSDIEGIIPPDTSVYFMETSPKVEQLIWKFISHPMTHPVDYIALSTMRRILTNEDKSIILEVTQEDINEVDDLLPEKDVVVVHPGRGWPSKTFPNDWWLDVIKGLQEKGLKVAVIGKHIGADQGYLEFKVPEGVYDLRDMLSLGGLMALLKEAPILISNDSAPVHIAGAFDNWIVLIPSCKHPDHVLPYRNGTVKYKTKAIYRRLTCDAIESYPTSVMDQTVDKVIGDIRDYLPLPEEVVKSVTEIKEEGNGKSVFE